MDLVTVFNNRDSTVEITVKDASGDNIVINSGDSMRVKIGTEQNDPILDIEAGTATANGSNFSLENPFTLTLVKEDLAMLGRGIHSLEVSFFDSSQANDGHLYFAQHFALEVRGTQGGGTNG